MENEEVSLSVGKCLVRGMDGREIRERMLLTSWKAAEYDDKLKNARNSLEKEQILKAKANAILDVYFRHLSEAVVKHEFKLGSRSLADYIGSLLEDDIKMLEEGINKASSLTKEERADFTVPSETINLANTTATVSLSADSSCTSNLISDGVKSGN